MLFSFGRKRRTLKGKVGKKPPARLLKACKKHGIRCTKKIGKKRRYKKISVLKRQLAKKLRLKKRKSSKKRKGSKRNRSRSSRRRKFSRRFRFGDAAAFKQPANYGYNEKPEEKQGILSQSSQVVTPANNMNRPPGFGLDPNSLPTYGVYRPFFTEQVPTQVGPNSIGFMGQPDGSLYPVGGPFSRYTSFGKRRKRNY
jgi:hypothetical protein